jgi:3-phenylpropionate/trans-cinnamate dioxygenase ferredoxin subunit
MKDTEFVAIADVADIAPGTVRVVEHEKSRYAVCHAEGKIYVVDDTCTHDDGPLGEGKLDGCAIVCPRHGAKFDVRTGAVLQMPAAFPIRVYESHVKDGKVWIKAVTGATSGNR